MLIGRDLLIMERVLLLRERVLSSFVVLFVND